MNDVVIQKVRNAMRKRLEEVYPNSPETREKVLRVSITGFELSDGEGGVSRDILIRAIEALVANEARIRQEVIEECAKTTKEVCAYGIDSQTALDLVVENIRALKEEPCQSEK